MKKLLFAFLLAASPVQAADTPDALFVAGKYGEAARAGEANHTSESLAVASRAVLTDAMLREDPCMDCLKRAEALARAALVADPHNGDAHVWLAVALGYQVRITGILAARLSGIPEQARNALQAAVTEQPGDPIALSALGGWNIEVVRGAGGFLAGVLYGASESSGVALFDRAVKLAPGNVTVRYQIALSLGGYNPDRYHDRILGELDAAARGQPQNAYERAIQSRAIELAMLLRQNKRLAFDGRVRTLQGYR